MGTRARVKAGARVKARAWARARVQARAKAKTPKPLLNRSYSLQPT